jgi:hypothetical protein
VIALALKLPAEGSPVSGSRRVLNLDITPERMDDAVEALRELIGRLPNHACVLPLTDVSVADGRLLVVTPPVTGEALDEALQLYGPAAVDDALPRLRRLATALDVIASAGLTHGALHPHDIIVSADDTLLAGCGVAGALSRVGVAAPLDPRYAAPEVIEMGVGTAAGDQYSLAVIAHEWMFGSAVELADGFLAGPAVAGIDVPAMQRAFDAAAAVDPADRFDRCAEFCEALERSAGVAPLVELERAADVTELPMRGDAGFAAAAGSVFSGAVGPPSPQRQFGMPAMVATLLLGIVIGVAGMWRLAGSGAPRSGEQPQQFTDASMAPVASTPEPTEVVDAPVTPARDERQAAEPPPPMPDVTRAAQADAGLLIHSAPAGATVTIDGIERGVTPVAVRGLDLGTRRVGVNRPGYHAAERLVTLTAERPSRTLDVDLVAVARAVRRPAMTAASAPLAVSGSLTVDSRPGGALVSIDGRAAGTTPVTLTAVAPGRHTVRLERPGYRTVTTTVDVKAGARARVAARLEGGPNQE